MTDKPNLARLLDGVTTDEPEAGEIRAVIVNAKWKPCVHGGGWWVAQDADGRLVSLAPDGFAALSAALPDLTDPVTVHANMLRGTIAKPTVEQIVHLYGREAFQPMIIAAVAKALEDACLSVSEHADWPEDENGRTEQVGLFARVINAILATTPARAHHVNEPLKSEHVAGDVLTALPADVAGVVEDAGKVLEGTTPGPWRAWCGEGQTKSGKSRHSVCRHVGDWGSKDHYCVADVLGDDEDHALANARLIAWCREGVPALIALATAQAAQLDTWRRNARETFDAMCAMRNSINEHVPMPSLESDLLQGPENSVFCAAVAEAVVSHVTAQAAQIAGLERERVIPPDARNEVLSSENASLRQQVIGMHQHFYKQRDRAEAAETALAAMTKERDDYAMKWHVACDEAVKQEVRAETAEAKVKELEAQIATMIDADTVDEMLDSAQPIMAEACRGYEETIANLETALAAMTKERDAFRDGIAKATGGQVVEHQRRKSAEAALAAERAKVARLVEALKPFADYMADGGDKNYEGDLLPDTEGMGWVYLTVGDFRRARAAIREAGQ